MRATKIIREAKNKTSSLLRILPEVSNALSENKAVVALESTILAHGLPFPENMNLAEEICSIIRSKGATPATIAIKDGKCRIGLTKEELFDLSKSGQDNRAIKCSTRDIPFTIAKQIKLNEQGIQNQWGATTVASTMKLAHMAGISTFVTGGTGGVHRGGEQTLDISADLMELARTPVVVVSAGVKSILDIEKTIEVLETFGVPVAGYQTNQMPAFFSPTCGTKAPARVDSADEVALSYLTSMELGFNHGFLIAVPNNDPAGLEVEALIQATIDEADRYGIRGRDVTPYILKHLAEKSKGDSLKSNISLVKRNAAIGAEIAVAISKRSTKTSQHREFSSVSKDYSKKHIIVMGGAVVDIIAKPLPDNNLIFSTSNPGSVTESDGGVARNIAEVLGRLGSKPFLFTAVGNDSRGKALIQHMEEDYGISSDRRNISFSKNNTATYLAILDSKSDMHVAIADMEALTEIPIPNEDLLSEAAFLVLDANAPIESLTKAATLACESGAKVVFEPTSVPKAKIVCQNDDFVNCLSYAFPNVDELYAMSTIMKGSTDDLKQVAMSVLERMNQNYDCHLIITEGEHGATLATKKKNSNTINWVHFDSPKVVTKNATGAGDTLCGAFLHSILNGIKEEDAMKFAIDAAIYSLQCADRAISPDLKHIRV
jgi:pseudouridine-5'-phosphate glycosidase/sugar/nucleoside kinase (ribokinase family)